MQSIFKAATAGFVAGAATVMLIMHWSGPELRTESPPPAPVSPHAPVQHALPTTSDPVIRPPVAMADDRPPAAAPFAELLAHAGGDPERIVLDEQYMSSAGTNAVMAGDFTAFLDALGVNPDGFRKYNTYRHLLESVPVVMSGTVALHRIECGASVCAASFHAASEEVFETLRDELRARGREAGHPFHTSSWISIASDMGTVERRVVFATVPTLGFRLDQIADRSVIVAGEESTITHSR